MRLQGGEGLSGWVLNMKYLSSGSGLFAVTRNARRVSDYANVPRFGLRSNLLLDFAPSDTQRTMLEADEVGGGVGVAA